MRLGACVALEFGIGALTLGGAALGVRAGVDVAQAGNDGGPAHVSMVAPAPRPTPQVAITPDAALPSNAPAVTVAAPAVDTATNAPSIFGASDDVLLAPLRTAAVEQVKINHGGTSLSLRLDFVGGARAAFKPEQIHDQSNPRREVAAYVIDRLLGIGRVAPAFARTFTVDELVNATRPAARALMARRLDEEGIARKSGLTGVVMWWVPEIANARIGGFEIDSTDGVITWKRYLRAKATRLPAHQAILAGISMMTLFDFLIDNIDRWSGSNARTAPGSDELLLMDNTMSFTVNGDGHSKSRLYLERVQVFSRALVAKLRAVTEVELRTALDGARGELQALLSEPEIAALLGRRVHLLAYIDQLIAKHGEAVVLGFP